jgi:hypothetical protein
MGWKNGQVYGSWNGKRELTSYKNYKREKKKKI